MSKLDMDKTIHANRLKAGDKLIRRNDHLGRPNHAVTIVRKLDGGMVELAEREAFVDDDTPGHEAVSWDEGDDGQELAALKALEEEASGSPDWRYGETLIRESYFETYAQELAEDCCDMSAGNRWPFTCIDWAKAAKDLKQDYFEVDFDGVTYLIRA